MGSQKLPYDNRNATIREYTTELSGDLKDVVKRIFLEDMSLKRENMRKKQNWKSIIPTKRIMKN